MKTLNRKELEAVEGGDANDIAANVGIAASGASLAALGALAVCTTVAAPAVVVVGLGVLGLAGAAMIGSALSGWW
jgi:bacteriocin-like protein